MIRNETLDPDLPRRGSLPDGDLLQESLWRHHGSGMHWVLERMTTHPEEAAPLCDPLLYTLAQVTYAVRFELALTLADVLIRRLQIYYRAPDQGLECAERVALHMSSLLDKEPGWAEREVQSYTEHVQRSRIGSEALSTAPASREIVSATPPLLSST